MLLQNKRQFLAQGLQVGHDDLFWRIVDKINQRRPRVGSNPTDAIVQNWNQADKFNKRNWYL